MAKYIATIRHSSITSARHITIDGTLTQAKRAAAREFGGEQSDYRIVIALDDGRGEIIASRRVADSRWADAE